MRILIVGAGPTGLTAAVELARRGVPARIVDRNDGPTQLSKAVGINAESLTLLEPSGVTERLIAAGIKVREAHLWADGRHLVTLRVDRLAHRFNFLLALPQSETERILSERLEALGGQVERRTALVALDRAAGPVAARLERDGQTEEAPFDIVLGADGAHSAVREAVGLPFEGYDHRRVWGVSDTEIEDWPYARDTANLFLHRGGDVGFIVPIGPGRFRAVSNTEDALGHIPGQYRVARVLRTDRFHIPVRQVPNYRKDAVFLAGDAAHAHSPAGGRGMNVGMADACAFARRLAADSLDGYSAERHPAGRASIRMSEALVRMAQLRNPVALAARNLAMRSIVNRAAVQRVLLARLFGAAEVVAD